MAGGSFALNVSRYFFITAVISLTMMNLNMMGIVGNKGFVDGAVTDNSEVFSALCHRIYFEHPSEKYFPFVNIVSGVYVKTAQVMNAFPVYRNERGGSYFFLATPSSFIFAQSAKKGIVGFGLHAMSNRKVLNDPFAWKATVDNTSKPLGNVFAGQWKYYKFRETKYTQLAVKCVTDSMTDCRANSVVLTIEVTMNGSDIVNNPSVNNFNPVSGRFQNNRRVYVHDNFKMTGLYLFYNSGFWLFGPDPSSVSAHFAAKSTAVKPEFVTSKWLKYSEVKKRWIEFEAQVQCRGRKNYSVEDCSKSCRGSCLGNSLNETVCTCKYGYDGNCIVQQTGKMCNTVPRDSEEIINQEEGALSMEYCQDNTIRPLVCFRYNSRPLSWYGYSCPTPATTSKPFTSTITATKPTPRPWQPSDSNAAKEKINLDKHTVSSVLIRVFVIGIPILLPLFHYCCFLCYRQSKEDEDTNIFSICSLHAYFGVFFWLAFMICNSVFKWHESGKNTIGDILVAAICFIIFGYIYVVVESRFSSVMGHLQMRFDESNAEQYVRSLLSKKPAIVTSASCYHFETQYRQVPYTDSNGHTQYRTETYEERVTTWRGSHTFQYDYWKDNSDTANIPLPKFGEILRVKLSKEIIFSNHETETAFTEQTNKFINDNRHRDVHIDYDTDFDVAEFRGHMIAYNTQKGIPCWMNKYCFIFWSVFCLSWPYRYLIRRYTKKFVYKVQKEISIFPIKAITQQPTAPPSFHQLPPPQNHPASNNSDVTDFGPAKSYLPIDEVPPPYSEAIQLNEITIRLAPPACAVASNLGGQNQGYVHI